jgi:hypothetical protein
VERLASAIVHPAIGVNGTSRDLFDISNAAKAMSEPAAIRQGEGTPLGQGARHREHANVGHETHLGSSFSRSLQDHHNRQRKKCVTFVRKLFSKAARLLSSGNAEPLESALESAALEEVAEIAGAEFFGLTHPIDSEHAAEWSQGAVQHCERHGLCTSAAAAIKASQYFAKEAEVFSDLMADALRKHESQAV